MRVELTEVLACPVCLPDEQGLVAVVDFREGERMREGYLGCPRCETRFPVRGGDVHFGSREAGEAVPGEGEEDPERRAVEVGALLGLTGEVGGYVLLGPGLGAAAALLARAVASVEVLALGPVPPAGAAPARGEASRGGRTAAAGETAGERPTRLLTGRPTPLPVRSNRLRGVALRTGDAAAVAEAARALGPGGRLVLFGPEEAAVRAVEASALRVLAAEERALVAALPREGPGV